MESWHPLTMQSCVTTRNADLKSLRAKHVNLNSPKKGRSSNLQTTETNKWCGQGLKVKFNEGILNDC